MGTDFTVQSFVLEMYPFCFDISVCAASPKKKKKRSQRNPQELKCNVFMEFLQNTSYYGL